MKNTYTSLETFQASDGNTILFDIGAVIHFFKKHYEENYSNLTIEEKEEVFEFDHTHGDLIIKIFKDPIQSHVSEAGADLKMFPEVKRTPEEEYDHVVSQGKDDLLTEEQYQLKLERLRHHKEWYNNRPK